MFLSTAGCETIEAQGASQPPKQHLLCYNNKKQICFYCVVLTQVIPDLITHRQRNNHCSESQQSFNYCLRIHKSWMQLEDRQHLSMGNGTFTGIDRSLHVNWLCLYQKKASPVHKWLEFDSTGRADEITSPGLACQTDPAQLVQFLLFEDLLSISCATVYQRGLLPQIRS